MRYFLLILITSFFVASLEGAQYTDEVPAGELGHFISLTNSNKEILRALKNNRIPPVLKNYSPGQINALRVGYYAPYLTTNEEKAEVAFRIRHPKYMEGLLPRPHFLISQASGILEVANFLGKLGYVKHGEDLSSYREAVLNALQNKIISQYFISSSEKEQLIWQRITLHAYIYLGIIEGDLGGYNLYGGMPLPLQNAWGHLCSAKSNATASKTGKAKKSTQLYRAALLIKGYESLGKTKEQAFEEAERIWNAYNLPPSKRPRPSSKKERETTEEQDQDNEADQAESLMEKEAPAEQGPEEDAHEGDIGAGSAKLEKSAFSIPSDTQFETQIKDFIKDALTTWKEEQPKAAESHNTAFHSGDDDHEGDGTGGEGAGPDITLNLDDDPSGEEDTAKPVADSSKEADEADPMDDFSEDENAQKMSPGKPSKRKIESDPEDDETLEKAQPTTSPSKKIKTKPHDFITKFFATYQNVHPGEKITTSSALTLLIKAELITTDDVTRSFRQSLRGRLQKLNIFEMTDLALPVHESMNTFFTDYKNKNPRKTLTSANALDLLLAKGLMTKDQVNDNFRSRLIKVLTKLEIFEKTEYSGRLALDTFFEDYKVANPGQKITSTFALGLLRDHKEAFPPQKINESFKVLLRRSLTDLGIFEKTEASHPLRSPIEKVFEEYIKTSKEPLQISDALDLLIEKGIFEQSQIDSSLRLIVRKVLENFSIFEKTETAHPLRPDMDEIFTAYSQENPGELLSVSSALDLLIEKKLIKAAQKKDAKLKSVVRISLNTLNLFETVVKKQITPNIEAFFSRYKSRHSEKVLDLHSALDLLIEEDLISEEKKQDESFKTQLMSLLNKYQMFKKIRQQNITPAIRKFFEDYRDLHSEKPGPDLGTTLLLEKGLITEEQKESRSLKGSIGKLLLQIYASES
ncbi:MAG: hypothetical protein B7Y25_03865 [Alphaproteobacteria bacterium 16-39-46]|nr:MAG: hypothetical protein B7Y25_03865 [Alphaproteobacteria bacterium 16-39-46]OZA43294.1 MAG: hypothetical protein B7X84_03700 [Alphaproteobacteria bacterium 17-39-52]HQS84072.1 hypothetical protein [Alphaproteobacteria bacterium]HQS93934.1 hypothetical protein [Alphaproteobacteria bacterium]